MVTYSGWHPTTGENIYDSTNYSVVNREDTVYTTIGPGDYDFAANKEYLFTFTGFDTIDNYLESLMKVTFQQYDPIYKSYNSYDLFTPL